MYLVVVISLLLNSVQSRPVEDLTEKMSGKAGNITEKDHMPVSVIIETNKHAGHGVDGALITFGDIAVPKGFQNADRCTAHRCKWKRSRNGLVYVPYVIANQYSQQYNFEKSDTNNLNTRYDYNSVMHYPRNAFSRNNEPTIIPIPDNSVVIGEAQRMSPNDILRINRLYCRHCRCCHVCKQGYFWPFGLAAGFLSRGKVVEDKSQLSVSELLHRANRGIVPQPDEPKLMDDIAINEKNADPCTTYGCLWPKYSDGNVYIPYVIANSYSPYEVDIIQRGLDSFSYSTCIRFFPRSTERDYISIESRSGCYSYVGRQGYAQTVSLERGGCTYHNIVQHELIHALGFNHEQTRSDRDNHIQVVWENIIEDMKYNFNKIDTLNQGTPYDYSSVMQYERYAFSKNGLPTMIPIPDNNAELGTSTEMSQNDIIRINRLYQCFVEDKSAQLPVSELLHRANRGIVPKPDEPKLMDDIAVNERNADPCTTYGCLWPKSGDGKIYVPYVIANHYTTRELEIIKRGLDSFSYSTCIRFFPRSNERDYISIESRSGCYSYVGRQGYGQTVSLARNGCLYHSTVQHELLHALGFNHEQTRSDRDNHIQVVWDNISEDMKYNFNKINTLNQGTPYDYSSVMQYGRYAFSKNGLPTMIPIPDNNAALGTSTEMSQNDIIRINRLYQCCE
ncbi:low choriolytic enzyme-like protein [Labeo rohita]|uniref:Metalloendopeptidase n=1 Tax=Labeo rohita TaxID=84645 RepID=A0A498MCY6_LABRO|nr:low choriolytic enzyme-like protein [Labeo rohita]